MPSNWKGKPWLQRLPEPHNPRIALSRPRALPRSSHGAPAYLTISRAIGPNIFFPGPSWLRPCGLPTSFSQPPRDGPDTWLRCFKTVFPKYLSDWQMEILYAGARGEQIGNKMKDAREKNINSIGGQDGAAGWGSAPAPAEIEFLCRPAKRPLFVHASHSSRHKY